MSDLFTLYFCSLTAWCIRHTGTVTDYINICVFRNLIIFIQYNPALRVLCNIEILHDFNGLNAGCPYYSIRQNFFIPIIDRVPFKTRDGDMPACLYLMFVKPLMHVSGQSLRECR
ncbi:hypothetical protein D3C76_1195370 [compost metagenome]